MNMPMSGSTVRKEKIINVSKEQEIQIFAKQMLSKRLFLGQYQERRFVSSLRSYRDVVRVSDAEQDLKRDLETIKQRVRNFYLAENKWIGITDATTVGAPAGHCLWVILKDVPFGTFWFQIREVQFTEYGEIRLRIKCIRSVDTGDRVESSSFNPLNDLNESEENAADGSEIQSSEHKSFDFQDIILQIKKFVIRFLTKGKSLLTSHNIKLMIKFIMLLLIGTTSGFFQLLKFIGELCIKLMREISVFIETSTPIVLSIIDLFSKCVGGIFILIAMFWRNTGPRRIDSSLYYGSDQRLLSLPNANADRDRQYKGSAFHHKTYNQFKRSSNW